MKYRWVRLGARKDTTPAIWESWSAPWKGKRVYNREKQTLGTLINQ